MKYLLLLFLGCQTPHYSCAQQIKKEGIQCNCTTNIQVKYPDVAEEAKLQGTVIVEYEIDSACNAQHPVIIQSLGGEFDKEALRVAGLVIALYNKCRLPCRFLNCTNKKMRFPLTFDNPD